MTYNTKLLDEINKLKQDKDAVILAHYYVSDEVQEAADYIGDSYYLSRIAAKISQRTLCFAGVRFMGESAKILNPDKTVLLPEPDADCPMAHMADIKLIEEARKQYDDLAVVCYINSTAELKTYADVCVTSSNAIKIVDKLPNKNIYFIPDENLGRYIASLLPNKHFIFNDGFCPVHRSLTAADVLQTKKTYPSACILAHPECTADTLKLADYIGSTSEIIDYATNSSNKEFIICTEPGVFYELKKRNPDKTFYTVNAHQNCPDMKKITLEKIINCLKEMKNVVELPEEQRQIANKPLLKMLQLAD